MSARSPEVSVSPNGDGSIDVTIRLKGVNMLHDGKGRFNLATYKGPARFQIPFRGMMMKVNLLLKLWAQPDIRRDAKLKRLRFSFALRQKPDSDLIVA